MECYQTTNGGSKGNLVLLYTYLIPIILPYKKMFENKTGLEGRGGQPLLFKFGELLTRSVDFRGIERVLFSLSFIFSSGQLDKSTRFEIFGLGLNIVSKLKGKVVERSLPH